MKRLFKAIKNIKWRSALREIVLLVIGILIALQINNWNEYGKERDFEKKILAEIELALRSDLEDHIENRISRAEGIAQSSEVVLAYLNEEIVFHDSLMPHFWRLNWVMVFEPKTAPFETLKSKGIEIVSNDALRLKLLELYDYSYPRLTFFNNEFNTWTHDRIEPFCLNHFRIEKTDRGKQYRPLDLENLSKDPTFRNLAMEKKSLTEGLVYRMKSLKKEVEAVLNILKSAD